MLLRDRKASYLLLASITIVAALGLAACSRSQSASDSLTGPGRAGATGFGGGGLLDVVEVTPTTVTAGTSSAGSVILNDPAPVGGFTVTLQSSSPAATVPASVTVAAGATSAGFTATTTAVTVSTNVTITAAGGGVSVSTTLTVNPGAAPPPPPPAPAASLSAVSVNPVSVVGGISSAGTVTLTSAAPVGGLIVSLSSNSASAVVPASVTVAAGATSAGFTATTTTVTVATSVTLTGTAGAVVRTATLTVNPAAAPPPPPPASLSAVSLNPVSVIGGISSAGTITLTGAAPTGGLIVSLSSSSPAAAVPASVTIAAGATSAGFTATTTAVTVSTGVTITAAAGGVVRTATLTVNPAPASLSAVSVIPDSVLGGISSAGTVTLTRAAPIGGLVVSLTSSLPAVAAVPASVTIAAGATSAGFVVTTTVATVSTNVTLTATLAGVVRTAALNVHPPVSPCVSLIGKGGTVVNVLSSVPQFRLTRLRVDVVGDVADGTINTLGACTAAPAPAVRFISGTCNLTRNGVSVTATGAPLTFGPLTVPVLIIEPGVVIATDAAGNVLQIIWPALAGLPPGPPVLRFNLAQRNPTIATGDVLDATMTFNAIAPNGSTATFSVVAKGMVVPVLR